jgi:preprotein translocase subunit YajC
MFVTPAYAQAAGGSAGGTDLIMSILPFLLIFVIMYFLIIRPQRTQVKKREEMLKTIRRNDTVVTGGGVIGKVTKVIDDNELEVEIAQNTKIRVLRSMVADVRVKGEPVAANDAGKK